MKQYYPSVGLERLCGLFGKSRQAFYERNQIKADQSMQQDFLLHRVRSLRRQAPGLGGLTLYRILKAQWPGIPVGRDRFYSLLQAHGLLLKGRKRYAITTNSQHAYRKWPDLRQQLKVSSIEQLWVSDITYLETASGFVYLSLITDAYSRKVVGYHLSQRLQARGCLIALKKAIGQLRSPLMDRTLIHHSDRGVQYCCDLYVAQLQQNSINISQTASGSPYDNAVAERVNGIFKHIMGLNQVYPDYAAAVAAVANAIHMYNSIRPHRSLSNLTPEEVHQSNKAVARTWKASKKPPGNKLQPPMLPGENKAKGQLSAGNFIHTAEWTTPNCERRR